MNRAQRLAWFNLRVLTIAGPLCLIALVISLLASELAVAYIGFFILSIASLIMGLSPVLLRKEPGKVAFDERDRTIENKTHLIGYCTLWCFFIATCMIVNIVIGPIILVVTLITIKLVESVATLTQYSRGGKNE